MLENAEKLRILEEILRSPEFKGSKRFQDLLRFLVEETIAGRSPKEMTIGLQFFERESSFDPKEDPTVRVYLNNLRKKIEHYYLTLEKPAAYRLDIPKGRYHVEFVEAIELPPTPEKTREGLYRFIAVAAVLIAIAAAGLAFWLKQSNAPKDFSKNPVWSDFLQPNSRPILVVLGDYFFLYERSQKKDPGNFVRNMKINSPEEYRQTISSDPEFSKKYVPSDLTFLRPSASWGLAEIIPILEHAPQGYSLKLASQFSVEDMKTHNLVFIGSIKTIYALRKFLHIFNLEYSLSPASLRIGAGTGDSAHAFIPSDIKGGNYEKDFALVAKAAGPDGSTILLLLGIADSGVIEASRASTSPQITAQIVDSLTTKGNPGQKNFTIVMESEGLNQAVFKSQMRYFIQWPKQPSQPTSTTGTKTR
ncbi:MAG: hypothetical protein NTV54_07765 [Ignavibacteriales bacterium]|nr:hypothetical protein [Ignavibacteriales bacterium]